MNYTYGYIREATMAHLDLDEEEAQAMNLQARFHIFANEAMQQICGSKPLYKYFEVEIVRKYWPLVKPIVENEDELDEEVKAQLIREATCEELKWNEEIQGPRPFVFMNDTFVKKYWNDKGIYVTLEHVSPGGDFIAFCDKQCYKETKVEPTITQLIDNDAFGTPLPRGVVRSKAQRDEDFAYIGQNKLKFYKPGKYYIPARYMWFRFDSGIADTTEIDMPSDILLCIPLYIAAICLQIDYPIKAQIKRNEFELALAKCTSSDFMKNNSVRGTWYD